MMLNKIKNKVNHLQDNLKYGRLDNGSRIIKPMRILNKRYICIGNRVNILNNARMEVVRSWHGKALDGKLIIGDGTSIEQNCHIIAANELKIGNDCVISANVYISDCAHEYDDVTTSVMKQPLLVSKTVIGDGSFIGYGAMIMPGVNLGKHAIVGAGAVVTKDVPDYTVVTGVPAKPIKKYDEDLKQWVKL